MLIQNPEKVNNKVLMQFPEFKAFHMQTEIIPVSDDAHSDIQVIEDSRTPEESLASSHNKIRESLKQDVLSRVLQKQPDFFERLVVELFVKMGYGGSIEDAGKALGMSHDEGIDGTIKEDHLGLDVIYIQAKRWSQIRRLGGPISKSL